MGGLMGNPLLGAGMGLLASGYDSRVNPWTSAMQGMMNMQMMKNRSELTKARKEEMELKSLEAKQANEDREATAKRNQRLLEMYDKRATSDDSPGGATYTPDELMRRQLLEQGVASGRDVGSLLFPQQETPTPYSDAAKLNSDLRNGLISPEQFRARMTEINSPVNERDLEKIYKQEGDLRGEFLRRTGDFRDQERAYGRILSAVTRPEDFEDRGAADVALIFAYMKILDPGSTVREGEFATAEQTGGLPAYVVSQYNKIVSGQRLTAGQRVDFLASARGLYRGAKRNYGQTSQEFRGLASAYEDVDPSRVVLHDPLYTREDFGEALGSFQGTEISEEWTQGDLDRLKYLMSQEE